MKTLFRLVVVSFIICLSAQSSKAQRNVSREGVGRGFHQSLVNKNRFEFDGKPISGYVEITDSHYKIDYYVWPVNTCDSADYCIRIESGTPWTGEWNIHETFRKPEDKVMRIRFVTKEIDSDFSVHIHGHLNY